MNAALEAISSSWVAMGFLKSLLIAGIGGVFIACIRQGNFASSLWAGLMLLLPIAFFSGLLPISWNALPQVPQVVTKVPVMTVKAPVPQPLPKDLGLEEKAIPMDAEILDADGSRQAAPTPTESSVKLSLSKEQWLVCFWLSGGLLSLAPGLISMIAAHRLRRAPAPEAIIDHWREVAGDTADFVPVRISGDVGTPGVMSTLRPEVILPVSALDWTTEQLVSVLRHELHHLHRRDLTVRELGRLVRAVLWFHPAAWWVQSRLVLAQERAADESVIDTGVPAAEYAGHLLDTVADARLFPGIPMARRSQVGGRIHIILAHRERPGRGRTMLERCASIGFGILAAALATLGFSAPDLARAEELPAVADKGFRAPILDRNGEVIATSDPSRMPEGLRENPPLRWYPGREMIGQVSGLVRPGEKTKLEPIPETGLENIASLAEGKALRSTIDLGIQRLAWRELEQGQNPGSIVVMDPHSGEVLAMASWPSIDPNDYADGVTREEWNQWQSDPRNPLLNRAFTVHPPASFAKLILSLGAASNDLTDQTYFCGPLFDIGRLKVTDPHPANVHLGLRAALIKSSNTYFAQLARELGHLQIRSIWDEIITGRRDDAPWRIPAATWHPLEAAGAKPSDVDLGFAAMGTGRNEISLMDIARIMSAVADGNARVPSFIVGEEMRPSVPLTDIGISGNEIGLIRQALHDNVNGEGVGSKARLERIAVSGMPFTAALPRRKLAIPEGGDASGSGPMTYVASFAGYAPAEQPRYVVAVRVEGGNRAGEIPFYGGNVAGPMAGRLLQALLTEVR